MADADLRPCTAETLDRLLGADDRSTNPAAMMDPSQSVGQTPDAKDLCLLADDLVALLDAQAPHLIAASSQEEWHRACLYWRTATGPLRYHFWMADTSSSRMARLLGLGFDDGRQPARHRRTRAGAGVRPQRASSAGHQLAHLARALGTIRHQGVDAPPPDTIEGLLYALRMSVTSSTPADWPLPSPTRRPLPGCPLVGYSPLDPAHVASTDGIVFVRDVRRS
jgi:hypothetical protein